MTMDEYRILEKEFLTWAEKIDKLMLWMKNG